MLTSRVKVLPSLVKLVKNNAFETRLLTSDASPKPWAEIPGLKEYPYLGTMPHFLPYIGSIGPITTTYDMFSKLHERYGSIVRLGKLFARNPILVIFEPDHAEQIFRNENAEPNRNGFMTMDYFRSEVRPDVFGGASGLISAQGAEWKGFRSKVNPPLLLPHLVKLYAHALQAVAEEMMDRFDKIKNNHKYIESKFDFEMTRFSLESISVVALGKPVGCLRDDLPGGSPARQLLQCVRDIMLLTHSVEMGPPVWKWYRTTTFKKLINAYDTHLRLSQMYINEAREKIRQRTAEISAVDKSVLEKLLEVDEKVAVVMAIDMLAAGVDTVASQLISILYLLATNKDKQRMLRDEIRRGQGTAYVRAVIKESMRLRSAIGSNLRGTTKDHIVGGYLIPKGIDVIFANEYLTIQDRYYPRAKEFLPERYTVDKTDPLHHGHAHPMVSLPFGFGSRSCIGRRIAELEMECFLNKFFDRFEIDWYGDPIKYVTRSFNFYLPPYNFIISDAPK